MLRIPLCCLLVTLLAGCVGFELSVKTVIAPDGSCTRSVYGTVTGGEESRSPPTIRTFLLVPGPPYDVVKLENDAYSALAEFQPGKYSSGIRRRAFRDSETCATGEVEIEVTNLGIGVLYGYREQIASGADPLAFRAALAHWLEIGLDVLVEALRPPPGQRAEATSTAHRELDPRSPGSLRAPGAPPPGLPTPGGRGGRAVRQPVRADDRGGAGAMRDHPDRA